MKPGFLFRLVVVCTALVAGAVPGLARADGRAVLYPVTGTRDTRRSDDLEERLVTVLQGLGLEVQGAPGGLAARRPQTAAEMGGVATAAGATYVVLAVMTPGTGEYRLHLTVGYQPTQRMEELEVEVAEQEQDARLTDVLRSMVRPEGLGQDAVRLTGIVDLEAEEAAARARREAEARAEAEAAAAERARQEAAERARLEEEARQREQDARRSAEAAAREAQAEARRAQQAWEGRATYGHDGAWLVAVGVEGAFAAGFGQRPRIVDGVVVGQQSTGGGFSLLQARVGRMVPGVAGLELRAGLDVVLGVFGGIGVVAGGVYQWTPFVLPIHLGVSLEAGAAFAFTGGRDPGFTLRAGAIATWVPVEHLQVEVALPELGTLTNGAGAFTLGATVRVGYRFD